MSIPLALLTLLEEEDGHGFGLKSRLGSRTADRLSVNVGQVYTTLARLERDGLVRSKRLKTSPRQPVYSITKRGRARVAAWLSEPADLPPQRDELVLKVVLASARGRADAARVIKTERRSLLVAREAARSNATDDLAAKLLNEALGQRIEGRLRWLDACEGLITERSPRTVSIRRVPAQTPAKAPTRSQRAPGQVPVGEPDLVIPVAPETQPEPTSNSARNEATIGSTRKRRRLLGRVRRSRRET